MKNSITLGELTDILKEIPKKKIEEECHAWGCCRPHYVYVITEEDVLYYAKRFLEKDE
jgi:hypothetical protein